MTVEAAKLPYVQAKGFTPAEGRSIEVIVIHTMEIRERPDTAESCARYFATMDDGRKASAHYCVDNNSIVHCVQEKDVAWGAPGANRNGIHIEHAGFSVQTAKDWSDPYSDAMLKLSGQLAADICRRRHIPIVWLSPADLKAGKKGITSHANVSKAFKQSDHDDPGPGFPVQRYLGYVRQG